MFSKIFAGAVTGIEAVEVAIEVNLGSGATGLYIVGLPDNAVKESQERICAAFGHLNFVMPPQRVIVNLAPADLRKEGASFDLPIAVGVLATSAQVATVRLKDTMVLGELSLDGSIRGINGALPLALLAKEMGLKRIILPLENGVEAAVVEGIEVLGVESLSQVANWLNDMEEIAVVEAPEFGAQRALMGESGERGESGLGIYRDDFADVKGQQEVKRAFEIAAAGGHNIIMIGPPGSGKTMLSKRLPSIMPAMTMEESLETTKIYSVAGKLGVKRGLMVERPFRAPHNITSQVAIIGGGASPQPGEVSLANNGILFLDELPEFGRNVLEVLRQPLEEKQITISRARYSVCYPANFTLVASMNPCPCGYYNHPTKECSCSPGTVHRYLGRVSGPLLDRIDLHIEVAPVSIAQINEPRGEEESSEVIRQRVVAARERQRVRFESVGLGVRTNADMTSRMLREMCPLGIEVRRVLEVAMDRLQLSARAYDRIIKVARTIADLDAASEITTAHIAEAIGYRSLDRDSWGR